MAEQTIPTYNHYLGNGLFLEALSVDPSITTEHLEIMVTKKDGMGKFDLEGTAKVIPRVATLGDFGEIDLNISRRNFQVPEKLKPYRKVLGQKLDEQRIKSGGENPRNGNIIVCTGDISLPLDVAQSGYYDFVATHFNPNRKNPNSFPANLVPGLYPEGKTAIELMSEWGLPENARARYFAMAYLMTTKNEDEITFVQRGRDLQIAADVMSLFGSTPNPNLHRKGFNLKEYLDKHIPKELFEEFKLRRGEYDIPSIEFLNDTQSIPHAVCHVRTQLSLRDLVGRIFGDSEAIKEHPVVYSAPVVALGIMIGRFPILTSSAYAYHLFYHDEF